MFHFMLLPKNEWRSMGHLRVTRGLSSLVLFIPSFKGFSTGPRYTIIPSFVTIATSFWVIMVQNPAPIWFLPAPGWTSDLGRALVGPFFHLHHHRHGHLGAESATGAPFLWRRGWQPAVCWPALSASIGGLPGAHAVTSFPESWLTVYLTVLINRCLITVLGTW